MNQNQSNHQVKIEKPRKNDLIYAVIMILMLVFGVIAGTLMQMGHSSRQCNVFFNEWIKDNCECSEMIRDTKRILNLSLGMEVPLYGENKTED